MQSRLKRFATTTSEDLESEEEKSLYKIVSAIYSPVPWLTILGPLRARSHQDLVECGE